MASSEGKHPTAGTSSHITYPSRSQTSEKSSLLEEESLAVEEKRLWLGNLDPKITEFTLLKVAQRYGPIQQFDFLFHRSGPNIGLPRGYAFVEYEDRAAAQKCMASLNGKRILDRHIAIRWAHQAVKDYPDEQSKLRAKLPALGVKDAEPTNNAPKLSKDKAISAIEAKLMSMEREKVGFTIPSNKTKASSDPANPRSWNPGQSFMNQPQPQTQPIRYKPMDRDRNRKPYSR